MKKNLPAIIFISLLSCSEVKNSDILQHRWMASDKVLIEDGMYHSYTHYDEEKGMLVGDSLIPIEQTDSLLFITHILHTGNDDDSPIKDTLVSDTVRYEIRNFHGSRLLLYAEKSTHPFILTSDNDKVFPEKKIFNNVPFKIAGLTIGDSINTNEVEIDYYESYPPYLEVSIFKENQNVEVSLIGGNYVYRIVRMQISGLEVEDIVKVVSEKMNLQPFYKPMKEPHIREGDKIEYYLWEKNGVKIKFQRRLNIEDPGLFWTLLYDDEIQQQLLEAYNKPKTTIIQ